MKLQSVFRSTKTYFTCINLCFILFHEGNSSQYSHRTSKEEKRNFGRNYIHESFDEKYQLMERDCSYFDCFEGGCRFQNCGIIESSNISTIEIASNHTHCTGGMCEFVDTINPTCSGGACVFIRCQNSSCDGGGCHHVHPRDTLKYNYCNGGRCLLNNEAIPSSLNYYITY